MVMPPYGPSLPLKYRMLLPEVFVLLAVFAFNLVGDGIRDAFDPTMQP